MLSLLHVPHLYSQYTSSSVNINRQLENFLLLQSPPSLIPYTIVNTITWVFSSTPWSKALQQSDTLDCRRSWVQVLGAKSQTTKTGLRVHPCCSYDCHQSHSINVVHVRNGPRFWNIIVLYDADVVNLLEILHTKLLCHVNSIKLWWQVSPFCTTLSIRFQIFPCRTTISQRHWTRFSHPTHNSRSHNYPSQVFVQQYSMSRMKDRFTIEAGWRCFVLNLGGEIHWQSSILPHLSNHSRKSWVFACLGLIRP